jgi:hypothetical protein
MLGRLGHLSTVLDPQSTLGDAQNSLKRLQVRIPNESSKN